MLILIYRQYAGLAILDTEVGKGHLTGRANSTKGKEKAYE